MCRAGLERVGGGEESPSRGRKSSWGMGGEMEQTWLVRTLEWTGLRSTWGGG